MHCRLIHISKTAGNGGHTQKYTVSLCLRLSSQHLVELAAGLSIYQTNKKHLAKQRLGEQTLEHFLKVGKC